MLRSTIIGLEDHTPQNIDEVIAYAVRYDTDFHQFMLYTPIPGTPLHAALSAQGRMKDESEYHVGDIHGQLIFNERHAGLGSKRAAPASSFEFGGARINFETFRVTVRGELVRMTQMEMNLLRCFVQNEGRVIPGRELLENVWGMPGYLNTRAPDQFIRRLRKAFEPDLARPRHFLTIRDAGYRFVAAGAESWPRRSSRSSSLERSCPRPGW